MFSGQVKVIPFPWKEYLLAAFMAPIALLFLFGLIIQGFEMLGREEAPAAGQVRVGLAARLGRGRYLLGLAAFMAMVLFLVQGKAALARLTAGIKALGLGGSYLLIALLALAFLYLPLRLWLRYRLQKKAMISVSSDPAAPRGGGGSQAPPRTGLGTAGGKNFAGRRAGFPLSPGFS
jgi:hypothetical protein